MEPEHVAERLQSHHKTWMDEELLPTNEQRVWFLKMECTLGKDAVKNLEMTTKDLEYYMSLVGKAAAGFERTNSNLESSTGAKTASRATKKSFVKRRVNRCSKLHSCLIFKKLPPSPHPSAPPRSAGSSHQHWGRTLPQQKDDNFLKVQMTVNSLQQSRIFQWRWVHFVTILWFHIVNISFMCTRKQRHLRPCITWSRNTRDASEVCLCRKDIGERDFGWQSCCLFQHPRFCHVIQAEENPAGFRKSCYSHVSRQGWRQKCHVTKFQPMRNKDESTWELAAKITLILRGNTKEVSFSSAQCRFWMRFLGPSTVTFQLQGGAWRENQNTLRMKREGMGRISPFRISVSRVSSNSTARAFLPNCQFHERVSALLLSVN